MNKLIISKLAAIGFIVILFFFLIGDNRVDPTWMPVSEYALGPFGWLMKQAFVLLGISFFTLGYFAFSQLPNSGSKIGGVLLMLASLGNFTAGIFNSDPINTMPDNFTTSGQIHNGAAGLLIFMLIATIFVAFQFSKQEKLKTFKKRIVILTILLWSTELILIGSMGYYLGKTGGIMSPETPIGWLGRLVIVLCAVWCWVCAQSFQKAFIDHRVTIEMS